MSLGEGALAMLVALLLDRAIGWPEGWYRRIGHPVTWIGAVISGLDASLNRPAHGEWVRRVAGVGAALAVIGLTGGVASAGVALAAELVPGWLATGVLAWPLVAARSLEEHVVAVEQPLGASDLEAARGAVAMIVGRDITQLDAAGVGRAAIESLAENTSDGVVAPVLWGLVFGLPGMAGYKALNTLDSMIGHRTPRHEAFGWASARLDDLANLLPARLTAVLFALTASRPWAALAIAWRDAHRHRSPNAGWPEAAVAGALGVRLSGPRVYADRVAREPWLHGEAPDPVPADLGRALALYRRALLALAAGLAVVAFVGWP